MTNYCSAAASCKTAINFSGDRFTVIYCTAVNNKQIDFITTSCVMLCAVKKERLNKSHLQSSENCSNKTAETNSENMQSAFWHLYEINYNEKTTKTNESKDKKCV